MGCRRLRLMALPQRERCQPPAHLARRTRHPRLRLQATLQGTDVGQVHQSRRLPGGHGGRAHLGRRTHQARPNTQPPRHHGCTRGDERGAEHGIRYGGAHHRVATRPRRGPRHAIRGPQRQARRALPVHPPAHRLGRGLHAHLTARIHPGPREHPLQARTLRRHHPRQHRRHL